MAVAITAGLLAGGFFEAGSVIWTETWGKITLIDLYVGLVFFAAWIGFRERSRVRTVAWWVGLVVLGNLAAAIYLVVAAFSSRDTVELLIGESL